MLFALCCSSVSRTTSAGPVSPSTVTVAPSARSAATHWGAARGEVVYANYGTKADFETLARRGVTLEGRIVVARYGKNFRGFKAKFAEAAGAAGIQLDAL